jgi:uncharacterized protein YlzI (FlbEa/FlbD family)
MIELTALSGNKIFVNLQLVRMMDGHHETTLYFIDGQKLIVREKTLEIATLYQTWLNRTNLQIAAEV